MSSSDAKPSANIIDVATVYDNCKDVLQEGRNKLARNMLSRNNVVDVLRDSAVAASYTYKYSDSLKQQGKATSQRSSGRCWIFACLNVIRLNFIKKFNLSNDFELSQSYLFFFDKLERVQFFLDNIVDTASEASSHYVKLKDVVFVFLILIHCLVCAAVGWPPPCSFGDRSSAGRWAMGHACESHHEVWSCTQVGVP